MDTRRLPVAMGRRKVAVRKWPRIRARVTLDPSRAVLRGEALPVVPVEGPEP